MNVHAVTFDRIEEQCLARFIAKFPTNSDEVRVRNKQELADLMTLWLEFWIEERPITKSTPPPVIHMKQLICDAKCIHIKDKLERWGIIHKIPKYLLTSIP